MKKIDRRKNDNQLDAIAIAKGLRRRKEDRENDKFYFSIVGILSFVLAIFFVGSFYVN